MLPIKFNTSFSSFYTTPPRFSLSSAFGKNVGVLTHQLFLRAFLLQSPLSFLILEETFGAKAASAE